MLKLANALLLLGITAEASKKLEVVVGGNRAGAARRGTTATAPNDEPQQRTNHGHEQNDQNPRVARKTPNAVAIKKRSVDERVNRENHGRDCESKQQAGHSPSLWRKSGSELVVRAAGIRRPFRRLHLQSKGE